MGGYVVRLRDGRRAYLEGSSAPEFSEDRETCELRWTFDVRLLADEPYHSLPPLQPSERLPFVWDEAPESLNKFLKRLAAERQPVRPGPVAVHNSHQVHMLTQLNPPLPMETPKGAGLAHFVIDYGPESHLLWVVFMDVGGGCWTVPNPEVRMQCNWTVERREAKVAVPQ